MNRFFVVLSIFLGLSVYPFLMGCGQAETETSRAVAATMEKPSLLYEWEEADVYNGRALLSKDGVLAYWVTDERVYAVNGASLQESPSLLYSPPSVNLSVIKAAISGKSFPQPAHLGLSIWMVPTRMEELAAANKGLLLPEPINGGGAHAATEWAVPLGAGQSYSTGVLQLTEHGGLVTLVEALAYIYKKAPAGTTRDDLNRRGISAIAMAAGLVSRDEAEELLPNIIGEPLMTGRVNEVTFEHKGMHFIAQRRDMENAAEGFKLILTIRPAK